MPEVAVMLLVQAKSDARAWLFGRLVLGPRPLLAQVSGLRFARVLGSGHEGGFGLRPSFDRGGLFALFDTEADARRFIEISSTVARYRAHAAEMLVAVLRASSVRGASLTRASIRPTAAAHFWRHAAPSQAALADAGGCLLLAGLGEAPLLRQATFSLWRDNAAMDAYARQGPHQAAIRAAYQQRFFSESMFVRFVPLFVQGTWKGRTFDLVQSTVTPTHNVEGGERGEGGRAPSPSLPAAAPSAPEEAHA